MKRISWDSMADPGTDEERARRNHQREARSAAIAWLGLAKKPSGKVRLRLRDQGYDEALIASVIADLREDGYLDDLALARRVAAQRRGRQAESRYALSRRMQLSGLDPDAVRQAVAETGTDHELAESLLETRFAPETRQLQSGLVPPGERQKLLLRIARFLSNRGFDRELIERLLQRHMSE